MIVKKSILVLRAVFIRTQCLELIMIFKEVDSGKRFLDVPCYTLVSNETNTRTTGDPIKANL